MEGLIKFLFHIIGFFIIYYCIDYKREVKITSLSKNSGWVIMVLIAFASVLIRL